MRKPHTPEQVFAQLADVWQTARGSRVMPARADINPARAGSALHYAALVDVVPGSPVDFRYRLIGQHLIESYGRNLTGALHSTFTHDRSERPGYDAYVRCVETQTPQAVTVDFLNHNDTPCRAQVCVWPLSDDGSTVTGLLAACIYVKIDDI
jgi:hypothetical protein